MTETNEILIFSLPPKINHETMSELASFLSVNRGEGVSVEADEETQIGAQLAQILVVAAQTWAADRAPFQINDPTGSLTKSFGVLGLNDQFGESLVSGGVDE